MMNTPGKIAGCLHGGAVAVLLALALLSAIATASATASDSGRGPAPPGKTTGGSGATVTVKGVERDPRFGRAWLLARLSGEGHLRMVSTRVKSFAPPGEYAAGFVRIPLVPKLPAARRLRREGSVLVRVTIYFHPHGAESSRTVQRAVTLVRSARGSPAGAHH